MGRRERAILKKDVDMALQGQQAATRIRYYVV
jgi:hypothetical protein